MKTLNWRLLFVDIRFWIVLFFIVRLYGIWLPPLEVAHNWRQTDGLMIARNFVEIDNNIMYPRVDLDGANEGIVGCEFPILNYLVYLVSVPFGYEHWYGRLIVLLFSCCGVFFFTKLVTKYFGELPALYSGLILMSSLWFSYSRKFIPDVFAASLAISAMYFAIEFLENGKRSHLFVFLLLGTAACLSKILTAVLLTGLAMPMLSPTIRLSRKVWVAVCAAVTLGAVCWWYFFWVPYLTATYGIKGHFFMGMTFREGMAAIIAEWDLVAKRFYDTPLKYSGFAVFAVSFFYLLYKKERTALLAFGIPFMSFLILLIRTGSHIKWDQYYILTAIPPMAFIAGYGLSKLKNHKVAIAIVTIVALEGISNQAHDFRIREPYASLASLESILDEFSRHDELILINAPIDNPTAMYFAHRRGWVAPNESITPALLADRKSKGCKYVLIVKKLYGELELTSAIVHDSAYFRVYKL